MGGGGGCQWVVRFTTCLQGLQIVGEVLEEALLLIRLEGGLTLDGAVKASQALLCDIGCLHQQGIIHALGFFHAPVCSTHILSYI